jgi:hypothetical protein
MSIARTLFGVGIATVFLGCAAKPSASRVVYVPMKEWREPEAAKLAHPEPGGIGGPAAPIKLTLHTPIKRRVSERTPDCGKSGPMTTCYEEQN